jgi:hypothetical protein
VVKYTINLYSNTQEERTSNLDKFSMNTAQYATEILELYLILLINRLLGYPEDYQTMENGRRVHARSTVKYMAVHAWTDILVPPTSTQSKMPGLYLKLTRGKDNRILRTSYI